MPAQSINRTIANMSVLTTDANWTTLCQLDPPVAQPDSSSVLLALVTCSKISPFRFHNWTAQVGMARDGNADPTFNTPLLSGIILQKWGDIALAGCDVRFAMVSGVPCFQVKGIANTTVSWGVQILGVEAYNS